MLLIRSPSGLSTALAAAALALLPGWALAADAAPSSTPDPHRPRTVIQERKYQPRHEVRVGLGYLPQDPFYKAYGPEIAYVRHLGDWVEWELLRVGYFVHLDSEIRRQIESEFDVAKDPYEKVDYAALSHLRWVPFYGRYTVLNRGVVHQETFLAAGAGLIGWGRAEGPRADGSSTGKGGARPAFDAGLGFRFYASKRLSFTIEVYDQLVMRHDGSLGSQFHLSVGGSWSSPRRMRPASLAASGDPGEAPADLRSLR